MKDVNRFVTNIHIKFAKEVIATLSSKRDREVQPPPNFASLWGTRPICVNKIFCFLIKGIFY